jgi:Fe2+ or Zn2+ uptake regulation protein
VPYIDPKEREPLSGFRKVLYRYLKERQLRYSDQREQVLKLLYAQERPLSIDEIARKLNEAQPKAAGYATVSRHIRFFQELGWLDVCEKTRRGYLLKIQCEVNTCDF